MARIETVTLDFHSLSDLDDGRINNLLKVHLQRVAQDCMNRPGDKTKRRVQLDFNVAPVPADDGQCDYVRVEIECKSKVPTYRSKPYEMRVSKGGLLFNRDFPDEIGQTPLFPKSSEEQA